MNLNYCCADLERLVHPKGPGLGLVVVIRGKHEHEPMFLLLYQKDWHVPVAEAGTRIKFCPYCGKDLKALFVKQEPI